jgi:membrane fusion protein, multidrug efflux system
MTRMIRTVAIALAVCSLAVLALIVLRPSMATEDVVEERQPTVEAVALEKTYLDKIAHFPGDLLPYEAVDIYAKVSGFIETLYADRGSEVKEKAVLAQLVAPELDKNIEAARAQYLAAEDQYRRSNKLRVGTDVAAQAVEILKDNAVSAHENLDALQEQKNYLTVLAPFDGVVTTRNLHTGAFVIAGGNNGAVPIFPGGKDQNVASRGSGAGSLCRRREGRKRGFVRCSGFFRSDVRRQNLTHVTFPRSANTHGNG